MTDIHLPYCSSLVSIIIRQSTLINPLQHGQSLLAICRCEWNVRFVGDGVSEVIKSERYDLIRNEYVETERLPCSIGAGESEEEDRGAGEGVRVEGERLA